MGSGRLLRRTSWAGTAGPGGGIWSAASGVVGDCVVILRAHGRGREELNAWSMRKEPVLELAKRESRREKWQERLIDVKVAVREVLSLENKRQQDAASDKVKRTSAFTAWPP